MSAYSENSFKASLYNAFRPRYPSSFFTILKEYVGNSNQFPLEKVIDMGCGTGQATIPLTEFSKQVTGIDPSTVMIATADENNKKKGLSFRTGSAEDLSTLGFEPHSIDLITAAECIHWYKDYPKFFKDCATLLKSGGCLTYWYYHEPYFVNYAGAGEDKDEILKQANEIYNEFVYDNPELIGPFWQQPGKNILREFLTLPNSHITDDFTDVVINRFVPESGKKMYPDVNDLDVQKTGITLLQYMDYIGTFSGLHSYAGNDEQKRKDYLERFSNELKDRLGWTDETTVDLVYNTGYTFLRRK